MKRRASKVTQPISNTARQRKRIRLWLAQSGRCAYCGTQLAFPPGQLKVTVDHVYPKSRGFNRDGNQLLSHQRCNNKKKARSPRPCEELLLHITNEILSTIRRCDIEDLWNKWSEGKGDQPSPS
jgi:5-methylcytosine-specific restriction endonuclease McrA